MRLRSALGPAGLRGQGARRGGTGRPALLLLDEPFGALDALTRASMHTRRKPAGRHRSDPLLVTHDLHEALKLADRVLLLRGGEVAEDLRPAPPA
ncbi:hypothetical protein [Deinococcus sp.]|uniref:hypothetical protein n=1 Tax=Deinococcus sp. TaxID=47478 RepID=UPI0025D41AC7|nr:hypothetical protein [Deinococcus sp.]